MKQAKVIIAYHYGFKLEYTGSLDIDVIQGLLAYLRPAEDQQQDNKPSIAERTAKKIAIFEEYKLKEEITRSK